MWHAKDEKEGFSLESEGQDLSSVLKVFREAVPQPLEPLGLVPAVPPFTSYTLFHILFSHQLLPTNFITTQLQN